MCVFRPENRAAHSLVSVDVPGGCRLYVFGGINQNTPSKEVLDLDDLWYADVLEANLLSGQAVQWVLYDAGGMSLRFGLLSCPSSLVVFFHLCVCFLNTFR